MKIGEWLKQEGKTQGEVARACNMTPQVFSRYVAQGRIPAHDQQKRIFLHTGGQVAPNDWHGVDEWRAELVGAAA